MDEIALLTLQESYCLSVLMYAAPALTLKQKQIDEMNACWNDVYRKIFGYSRTKSVKEVIYGLGRFNVRYLLLLRKVRFYKRLYLLGGFMQNLFWMRLVDNVDDSMNCIFVSTYSAVEILRLKFYRYVHACL